MSAVIPTRPVWGQGVLAMVRKLPVPTPSHPDHERIVCTVLRKSRLRIDYVYFLRRLRVPMTASAFWSKRPNEKWQHRLTSRTPTDTEPAAKTGHPECV